VVEKTPFDGWWAAAAYKTSMRKRKRYEMKKRVRLFAVALLAFGLVAPQCEASIISGTWNFTVGALSGSFSFTGLDTSQNYTSSTAAGFSVSTSFDTTGDGGNGFTYPFGPSDALIIGGLVNGVNGIAGINDWGLEIVNFSTNPTVVFFEYDPASGSVVAITGTITSAAAVPEPATLALIGLGLFGVALTRRRQ